MPKIAVYAGHGGSDYGATSNGLKEKDLTLQISNALTNVLRARGYEVINNRTTDVDRSIGRDARLANENNVDAVLDIHLNSNPGTPYEGSEVYYSVTGRGRELAQAILDQLVAIGFKNDGIKTMPSVAGQDYLGIIRNTTAPAVLVETLFINNPNDLAKYDPDRIAEAIAKAIEQLYPVGQQPSTGGNVGVLRIQQTLNDRYGTGLVTDGLVGSRTRRAIITGLQTELNRQFGAGLTVDGLYGPRTRAALPIVREGARGNLTYLIQAALYLRGYDLTPDGVYGPLTAAAIRRFQAANGLAVDGIAGPATLNRLFSF